MKRKITETLMVAAIVAILAPLAWSAYQGGFTYNATVVSTATSTFSIALDAPAEECTVWNRDASHNTQVKFEAPFPSSGTKKNSGWIHLEHPAAANVGSQSKLNSKELGMDLVNQVYIRNDQTGYQQAVDITAFCTYANE